MAVIVSADHDNFCHEEIASALRYDVVEGPALGFVRLPYRAITELGERDLDVVGGATQRRVVINVSGPDLVGKICDYLRETPRAWVLDRHVISKALTRSAAGATAPLDMVRGGATAGGPERSASGTKWQR